MLALLAPAAGAAGKDIPLYLGKPGDINVNGVLKEWGRAFTSLSYVTQGSASGCAMDVALAYDDQYLYLAGEITDHKLVRTAALAPTEDHAELLLTFPDEAGQYRTVYELELYAGVPGKSAGQVKARGLGVVSSAQIVEAPTHNGYDIEVKIPWNLFPAAARTRSGIRGAVLYVNSNGAGVAGVLSTADRTSPAAGLPFLLTAPEQSLQQLMHDRALHAPTQDVQADVAGDAMRERVLLADRFLIVLGPHFRDGTEFTYNDLGADASAGEIPFFEVRDVNGDGKADIAMRKRHGVGGGWREIFQILTFDASGAIQSLFEHETGISSSIGTVQNSVRLVPGARGASVQISLGTVTGYNAANYREPTETAREPLLLPWGTVRSRTYEWDGSKFKKSAEQKKEPGQGAGGGGSGVPVPQPPRPPTADELLDQVFALYRSERKIGQQLKPRFDFVTDVAEDERNERILVLDRDIVVFGKGFKQGRGYVYVTLSQYAEAKDIFDVTARDLTGDGHADILVRGMQRTKAPPELGTGDLVRETLFVYTVSPQAISRVFATETALGLEDKRIQGLVSFLAGRPGLDIELRPGRSLGWDRTTWPYKQDTEEVSGIEPLLLPWTKQPVRYRFSGEKFSR